MSPIREGYLTCEGCERRVSGTISGLCGDCTADEHMLHTLRTAVATAERLVADVRRHRGACIASSGEAS